VVAEGKLCFVPQASILSLLNPAIRISIFLFVPTAVRSLQLRFWTAGGGEGRGAASKYALKGKSPVFSRLGGNNVLNILQNVSCVENVLDLID